MQLFHAIDTFLDSLYDSWESWPAFFLLLATAFLVSSIADLTGWPDESTWDKRMNEEHDSSRSQLGWAVLLMVLTVVGTLVLAWLLSMSPMGNRDSFAAELVMIIQHAFGWLAVILVVIGLVAGAVLFMVNHS